MFCFCRTQKAKMNGVGVCSNCKERGHYAEKCPELWASLKEGFYSGGGGGGGGGGGDDDETLQTASQLAAVQQYSPALNKDDRTRRFFIHMDILPDPDCNGVHSHVLQGIQVPSISHKIRC